MANLFIGKSPNQARQYAPALRASAVRPTLCNNMNKLSALTLLFSVSALASEPTKLSQPILSPESAIEIFKSQMVTVHGAKFTEHVLATVAFSYTQQHWIINFDCTTSHPAWKEKDCGIYGYLVNNQENTTMKVRSK